MHTLEDSYAMGHTARVQTKGADGKVTFGAITRFQDYGAQDPNKHAKCDVLQAGDAASQGSYDASVAVATKLLKMLRDSKTTADDVRKWLIGNDGPLALAKGCNNGGTEPQFAPDPLPPPPTLDDMLKAQMVAGW